MQHQTQDLNKIMQVAWHSTMVHLILQMHPF